MTGKDRTPFWVAEGSHKWIMDTEANLRKLAHVLKPKLIYIEPWSLVLLRGDVLHAGSGGRNAPGKKCMRLHMYINRQGVGLANAINSLPYFKLEKVQHPTKEAEQRTIDN